MGITHAMCNFAPGVPKGRLRMGWASAFGKVPTWDACIEIQPNSVVEVKDEALFSASARVQIFVLVKDYAGVVHVYKMPAADCQLGKEATPGVERYVLPGANGFTSPVRAYAAARILPLPIEIHIMNESPFDLEISSVRPSKQKGLFPTFPPDRVKAQQVMKLICYPSIEPDSKGHVPEARSEQTPLQRLKLLMTLNFDDEAFRSVNICLLAALHGTVPGLSAMITHDEVPPLEDDDEHGAARRASSLQPLAHPDAPEPSVDSGVLDVGVPWHGKLLGKYCEKSRIFTFIVDRTIGHMTEELDASEPIPAATVSNGDIEAVPATTTDETEDKALPSNSEESTEATVAVAE